MFVFHGTTKEHAEKFLKDGIDAHLPFPRKIFGPQSSVPGIFVSTDLNAAKEFGRYVLRIEIDQNDLICPPNFQHAGLTLADSINNAVEPQAFISKRIEPAQVHLAFFEEPRVFYVE